VLMISRLPFADLLVVVMAQIKQKAYGVSLRYLEPRGRNVLPRRQGLRIGNYPARSTSLLSLSVLFNKNAQT
jgi:hypothetical protein